MPSRFMFDDFSTINEFLSTALNSNQEIQSNGPTRKSVIAEIMKPMSLQYVVSFRPKSADLILFCILHFSKDRFSPFFVIICVTRDGF